MFAYPDDRRLGLALSHLAREELRHFEQVMELMQRTGVALERRRPGRYASRLRAMARSFDPGRKLDLLLIAALIEARSCERFGLLAPRLSHPLAELYSQLERSEARHFERYLELARAQAPTAESGLEGRLRELAGGEAELATAPDAGFHFHSGPPA
jgi:tRNA-(ms[2]io[6]A)-hydroxylase